MSVNAFALPFNPDAWCASNQNQVTINWYDRFVQFGSLKKVFPDFASWYNAYSTCYEYALGDSSLFISRTLGNNSPGIIDGVNNLPSGGNYRTWYQSATVADFAVLDGLEQTFSTVIPKRDYWPVALFVLDGEDFHWVRMNHDGTWSSKFPNNPPKILSLEDGMPVIDPRDVSFSRIGGKVLRNQGKNIPYCYNFVSFFNVPNKLSIPRNKIEECAIEFDRLNPQLGVVWRNSLNALGLRAKGNISLPQYG